MNILVTGSNGFIGDHVCRYLKEKKHYVIGLGRRDRAFDANHVDEYISCDLASEKASAVSDMASVNIDAIVHLAADMRKEPHCVEVISANCCGTQRILEMCETKGIKVFVQLSSLPVIGHPIEHPITERHPLNPYTVYHITKRTEEMLANYACEYHGIRTASFRISAPIGTRVNPNTIFPTFIRKALRNEDLTLLGHGTRKQNYLYVDDISRCIESALLKDTVHGVYNLTSDLLISNYELAQTIIKVLGSHSRIVLSGVDPADEYVWDASLDKLKRDSGYEPQGNMENMIREYADWMTRQGK